MQKKHNPLTRTRWLRRISHKVSRVVTKTSLTKFTPHTSEKSQIAIFPKPTAHINATTIPHESRSLTDSETLGPGGGRSGKGEPLQPSKITFDLFGAIDFNDATSGCLKVFIKTSVKC